MSAVTPTLDRRLDRLKPDIGAVVLLIEGLTGKAPAGGGGPRPSALVPCLDIGLEVDEERTWLILGVGDRNVERERGIMLGDIGRSRLGIILGDMGLSSPCRDDDRDMELVIVDRDGLNRPESDLEILRELGSPSSSSLESARDESARLDERDDGRVDFVRDKARGEGIPGREGSVLDDEDADEVDRELAWSGETGSRGTP